MLFAAIVEMLCREVFGAEGDAVRRCLVFLLEQGKRSRVNVLQNRSGAKGT